jgi:hypothetical protein
VTWGGSIKEKRKVESTHLSRKILSLDSDKNGRFGYGNIMSVITMRFGLGVVEEKPTCK